MNDINYKDRYWLFGSEDYYPEGGLKDIKFTSDNLLALNSFYVFFEKGEGSGYSNDMTDYCWEIYDSEEHTYKEFKI